jgi:nondiscriminating glutamyl-tRNA synthetase
MTDIVRVRFAPSPTGLLHIGGVRTALFNWLFARREKGKFILRIEDTDKERSSPEFDKDIQDSLRWLGLEWDEFYRQSDRIQIYRDYLLKLIKEGWVYYCFCTQEELETERQAMLSQGQAPKYSGRCRSLSVKEVEEKLANGAGYTLRFKVHEDKLTFKDLIRGNITFDTSLIGDVIIAKDLEQPLYNFAVVIDDSLTKITHVIRGEEHISNTPRQILLMNALGFNVPQFAHLPIILNPDKTKMSKRFSDTSIREYIRDGYLPGAMFNFLAFLGWHPKEDIDIMSSETMVKEFRLDRVQKGAAVFNIDKLNWLNGKYISDMGSDEFINHSEGFIPKSWKLTLPIIDSVKTRITKLSELKSLVDFYFQLPDYGIELLRWKDSSIKDVAENLRKGSELIKNVSQKDFKRESLENKFLNSILDESRGEVLWPLRVALSGRKASPSPFEIMEALGKEESQRRIDLAIEKTGILGF